MLSINFKTGHGYQPQEDNNSMYGVAMWGHAPDMRKMISGPFTVQTNQDDVLLILRFDGKLKNEVRPAGVATSFHCSVGETLFSPRLVTILDSTDVEHTLQNNVPLNIQAPSLPWFTKHRRCTYVVNYATNKLDITFDYV